MTEIPKPHETGSAGTQQPGSADEIAVDQENPFPQPMVETVRGLASQRPRSMGGDAPAMMLSAAFTEVTHDLTEAKSEIKTIRTELDLVRSELSSCQKREAVLEERVSNSDSFRRLSNLAMIIGTSLLGSGVALYIDGSEVIALFVGVMGLLLLSGAWFWPKSGQTQP